MKQKENAMQDFLALTRKSWTYERMTEDEKYWCEKSTKQPRGARYTRHIPPEMERL